ncbi:glycosyltransferase family 9 protein [Planktothricoides raciborskii]|uniref:Glycosyltransferase family 9 protein n=1 Tax=Planktothricoides raciborskii GIHE-MW2 TaxID=2792601 RepID=A0AAU8J8A6_9CYAN
MRILALVPGGIGDQILFLPTIQDIKQFYPNAQIDVVVEPRSLGAYKVCKHFHDKSLRPIKFDFKDRNSLADFANLLGILRDGEYDAVISLGQRWAVGFLLWLTGIPTRVGYAEGGSDRFLTNPVPLKTEQYAAAMYHDLLQGFDITCPTPELSVTLLKEDLKWAENEQKTLGIAETGYILIHGGSSQLALTKGLNKIYPVKNWLEILQKLQQSQPQLPIVVVKGPEDEQFVNELVKSLPGIKVISPPDIGKLAATIAGANLMICTDSAPMHLAVAVKTYTVALFGPTDPSKLLPKNERFVAIKSPTDNMADIPPKTVLQKILGG